MAKQHLAGLLLALSLIGVSAEAAEGDAGGYIGASIGQSTIEVDDFDFDESDTAFKLFGGYSFNRNFALELAYLDAGGPTLTEGTASLEVSASGFLVSAVGSVPLGERFALFGKLGVAFYDVEATVRVGNASGSADDSGNDFAYGIGMAVSLTDRFSLRAEYELINVDDGDFTLLTAGAVLKF